MDKMLFDMSDLSLFSGKSVGIYYYAMGLLRHVAKSEERGFDLVVACNGDNVGFIRSVVGEGVDVFVVHKEHPSLFLRQFWTRFGVYLFMLFFGCGSYFSPKGFLPGFFGRPLGVKSIVVVHDLIPLWYKMNFPSFFNKYINSVVVRELLRSCRNADLVVADSVFTSSEIVRNVMPNGRLVVVHCGLDEVVEPSFVDLPCGDYFFAISSQLPHKNFKTLMSAYKKYRELVSVPLKLVVCGVKGEPCEGVVYIERVPRSRLFGLYKGAKVFLFLSLIEGFGYPPLEAMQVGTPCICSDIPVVREITRGRAIYVNPQDEDAIARQLADFVDLGCGETHAIEGNAFDDLVACYSWRDASAKIVKEINSVLTNRNNC